MRNTLKKITLLFVIFTIFNISYADDAIPYTDKNSDKIFYCGLNNYIDSLSKYKNHFGKMYALNIDHLLYKKIQESEFGDATYEKDGFNELVKRIKENKDFCKNTFFITTSMKILKYNKELKLFPIEGITKSTQYTFQGTSRLFGGSLRFINADVEKNKIKLSGVDGKKFLKGLVDKYSRKYLTRIYFKVVNIDIDILHGNQIGSDVEASIVKIDFIDEAGYVHYTIKYNSTQEVFNSDKSKKITILDKYINLNKNKFTQLNDRLFNLLEYIYTSSSIDNTKLAFLASKVIKGERNKFLQKRMLKDIKPELEQLVQKVKSNSFTATFSLLVEAEYSLEKNSYIPNYYGVSKGWLYRKVNGGGLNDPATIFAVKLPHDVLQWAIPENEAERYSTRFENGMLIKYELEVRPKRLIKLKLEPNEVQGYIRASHGRASYFGINTIAEQAYDNSKFIQLDLVSGERKLFGMQNNNSSKNTLIKTEKLNH